MANKLIEALDPRVPIYRDSYNEYFVLILSAGGAVAGTAVPLYIVMAILDDLWSPGIFIAAEESMPFTFACACGLRMKWAWVQPTSFTSST